MKFDTTQKIFNSEAKTYPTQSLQISTIRDSISESTSAQSKLLESTLEKCERIKGLKVCSISIGITSQEAYLENWVASISMIRECVLGFRLLIVYLASC